METLDIEYIDLGDDYLTAKMPVTSKVHQPYGQLHGGATAALAETVGSAASRFFIDNKTQLINGIELTINQKERWLLRQRTFTKGGLHIFGKYELWMKKEI